MNNNLIYKTRLTIRFPSTEIPEDFAILKEEISNASDLFNTKHSGTKAIEIVSIQNQAIIANLISYNKPFANPGKEFSSFSKILYSNYGWDKYSLKENRLFSVEILESPKIDICDTLIINDDNSVLEALWELISSCNDNIMLENYIKILNELLDLSHKKIEMINRKKKLFIK